METPLIGRVQPTVLLIVGVLLALAAASAIPAPAGAATVSCDFDPASDNDGTSPGGLTGKDTLWATADSGGDFEDGLLLDHKDGLGRNDAFDDYGLATIGTTSYDNPDPDDDGCKRINHGHGVLFPTDDTLPVDVTPILYADPKKPFGRQLFILKNTSGSDQTFDFQFDGDLGSDSLTNVDKSSSGNGSVNQHDIWATSCDDIDSDGCVNTKGEQFRDPELAHNWQGKGNVKEKADDVALVDGDGNIDVDFDDVKVKDGKTVALMEIVSLHPTIKPARSTAAKIAHDPQGYGVFNGLTKKQRGEILNW
jgi:hypothetical protein